MAVLWRGFFLAEVICSQGLRTAALCSDWVVGTKFWFLKAIQVWMDWTGLIVQKFESNQLIPGWCSHCTWPRPFFSLRFFLSVCTTEVSRLYRKLAISANVFEKLPKITLGSKLIVKLVIYSVGFEPTFSAHPLPRTEVMRRGWLVVFMVISFEGHSTCHPYYSAEFRQI